MDFICRGLQTAGLCRDTDTERDGVLQVLHSRRQLWQGRHRDRAGRCCTQKPGAAIPCLSCSASVLAAPAYALSCSIGPAKNLSMHNVHPGGA